MKRKTDWLIAAFVVLSALLTLSHLRLPRGMEKVTMNTSAARQRAEERMNISLPDGSVDINRAGTEELQNLHGVGPVLAQTIVEEREANGDFHYPEDLLNVKGIGRQTLKKILPQLRLP